MLKVLVLQPSSMCTDSGTAKSRQSQAGYLHGDQWRIMIFARSWREGPEGWFPHHHTPYIMHALCLQDPFVTADGE